MSRLALIVVVLMAVACESPAKKADEAGTSATTAPIETTPAGTPSAPPDTFGALMTDVDRVVIARRTPPGALVDAGSGDEQHPAAWETSDPEWIDAFSAAFGPRTKRIERERAECAPWADLTLYSGAEVRASFAVECPVDSIAVLRTRPPTHVFEAAEPSAANALLNELR